MMIRALTLLALLLVVSVGHIRADAIVRSQAMRASTILEAYVENEEVRLEIEVGAADIAVFADLLPDEIYNRFGGEPAPHLERIERFFNSGLVLAADGQNLSGRLVSIEPRERIRRDVVTGEATPLAEGEEVEKVLLFVLSYQLPDQPKTLSVISVPRSAQRTTAAMGFVLYHNGVGVNDFRYLMPGHTVQLDWDDPWHTRFAARPMKRAYDAPLNVFLYAEPFEVRVEVVVRPLDLQPLVDLGLEGRSTIKPDEYPDILAKVAAFLAGTFELEIDGKAVVPELERVNFLRRTLRSSVVIDPPEELNIFSAQLGVIYVAPVTGLPQEARLKWSVFPEKIQVIPTAATDEAGPLPGTISREDPVLVWKNFLTNPTDVSPRAVALPRAGWTLWLRPLGIATAVLATIFIVGGFMNRQRRAMAVTCFVLCVCFATGSAWMLNRSKSARVDADDGHLVVSTLLYNIYRSFDFRDDDQVYEMISASVDGDLLEDIFIETRQALVLKNQGGARAKVTDIELAEVSPRPVDGSAGFEVDADWTVAGSVGHWGHIHQRSNRYRATVTVEPVDGAWKIVGMDVHDEQRLQ